MAAFGFSILYIFAEALQPIYQDMGFSEVQSSLAFLGIFIGGIVFSPLTHLLDHCILNSQQKLGQPIKLEDKLTGLIIGAFTFATGQWWFAWMIPSRVSNVHWLIPTAPLTLVGYGLNEFEGVLIGYLGDSYLSYSASAIAAVQLLRNILSGVFPLFSKSMFENLGNNVAMSVLASLSTVFCIFPLIFVTYGEQIRGRSKFARHSLDVQAQLGKDDQPT